jgi:hypothetical protein
VEFGNTAIMCHLQGPSPCLNLTTMVSRVGRQVEVMMPSPAGASVRQRKSPLGKHQLRIVQEAAGSRSGKAFDIFVSKPEG